MTPEVVLTSFIKHLLLTLFFAHRGLLMERIKKRLGKKFCHTGSVYNDLMERYFALKISSLIFRRPKDSVLKVP